MLPSDVLPHLDERVGAWPGRDLGDYVGIEKGVLNVRDGCLSFVNLSINPKEGGNFVNPVGYDIAGLDGGIGIFLWDTEALINRIVVEEG